MVVLLLLVSIAFVFSAGFGVAYLSRRKRAKLDTNPNSMVMITSRMTLAALHTEKRQLNMVLKEYERRFFRLNKRQVSTYQDIKPVATLYRRYKELKRAILTIQQQQRGN